MTIENSPLAHDMAPHGMRGNSRSVYSWILAAFLGAVLTVVLVGALVWLSTGLGLLQLLDGLRGGHTLIKVDQPTVVHQIQQLQRLETVSYTMDKIISGEHDNPYLPQFLAGDRLLLVVHGEVVGGINLAGLQPGDVLLQGQKALIHLPPAEILSTRIDNAKTRVYSRDTGLFSLQTLTSKAKSAKKLSVNSSRPRCKTASSRSLPKMRAVRSRECLRASGSAKWISSSSVGLDLQEP